MITQAQREAIDAMAVACRIAVNYITHASSSPKPPGPEERHLRSAAAAGLHLAIESGLVTAESTQ